MVVVVVGGGGGGGAGAGAGGGGGGTAAVGDPTSDERQYFCFRANCSLLNLSFYN